MPCSTYHSFCLSCLFCQSYQWLKEKIVSEDGRKQQAKLKELNHIAEKLGCTLPQLAVVLLGTSNPEQLTENLGAIQVLPKMTSHIVSDIDHILGNRPYKFRSTAPSLDAPKQPQTPPAGNGQPCYVQALHSVIMFSRDFCFDQLYRVHLRCSPA
ncbi:hypothetical protein GOODEAATRI_016117 [Goodea atripinnis]|uniref:Uncharacterized protein n=1 Tax=Goodea atripinnis TaxID=208336 RepID=A0ABV0N1U9_9TELE